MELIALVGIGLAARAVRGAPSYGRQIIRLLRDWRSYRQDAESRLTSNLDCEPMSPERQRAFEALSNALDERKTALEMTPKEANDFLQYTAGMATEWFPSLRRAQELATEIIDKAYAGAKDAPTEEEVLSATADAFWNQFEPEIVPKAQRKPIDLNTKIALLALVVTILQLLVQLQQDGMSDTDAQKIVKQAIEQVQYEHTSQHADPIKPHEK